MLEIVASIVGGAVLGGIISVRISRYYARKSSKELREVSDESAEYLRAVADDLTEELHHRNQRVARAWYESYISAMRDAGFKLPLPGGTEPIELQYHSRIGPRRAEANWPEGTWRVRQGEYRAYTDNLATMLELLGFLMWEVQASDPPDDDEMVLVKRGGILLSPEYPEWTKGVHVLDVGS